MIGTTHPQQTIKELARQFPTGIIARALTLATKAHAGQKRKTGEPYLIHPTAVAQTLVDWNLDEPTIAAGILHDTVEDTATTLADLEKEFGGEVANLVNGITKIGKIKYRNRNQAQAENLRKLILAVSDDIRVVFIKLADRLHNMRTLAALPPQKQKRIAAETDEIYAPLAYRLGMQQVAGELQDLAFPYLHPEEDRQLKKIIPKQYGERLEYLEKMVKPKVEDILAKNLIQEAVISFRAKRYSSIYKKLIHAQHMDIKKINDLVAVRIIVKSVADCYAALGVIHEHFPPLPGRIKDYIAMPKPNGYRSLHTTVIGPQEQIIEFQIRTQEMHEENETGIAAHWLYKQKKAPAGGTSPQKNEQMKKELAWVQQLRAWQEREMEHKPAEEVIQTMKIDFFQDRIFAITPAGDVVDLPAESTPVDFAYRIHTQLGNTCTAAKVNGVFVPLDHTLHSGDMVEILTQKNKLPSPDWLDFAKSPSTREHIKAAIRQKPSLLHAAVAKKTEFRVVVQNRIGLLKDLAAAIARSHVNISEITATNATRDNFPIIKIVCEVNDRTKIEKLIIKIKTIKEVKEVIWKII